MYLKRLEIQGFKSFAGRNVFEFGRGITAVVGPNGSGKSNLADALRWVLGEQNPRALRSRRAEEVIFAGDRKRPPAGFAEVAMVLDNADGWLPVGFSEVVITRRLHRSGESDYLVNRARVRLRDVLDLFQRARVGQNSYAIMGQGLVDQVLNLRPEERRALLEEAADVRRHRARIQDAVDRLSATRDNLDRVDLLVGEIAPRLAQLEAQAVSARAHAELTAALADGLRALYTLQWRDRTAALAAAHAEYETRMRDLVAAQGAVERLAGELAGVRTELQTEQTRAAGAESGVRDLDDRLRRGEQRVQLLGERRTMLVTRLAEIEAERAALQGEQRELVTAEQDAEVPDDGAADVSANTAELRAAEQEQTAALRRLGESEDALRLARGQAASAEDRLGRAQRQLRGLEREQAEALDRRTALLARLRKGGAGVMRQLIEQRALDAELGQRSGDLMALRRQAVAARAAAETAENESLTAKRAAQEASARGELLARLSDERQRSDGALRALADAAARAGAGSPPRLLATLSSVMRVQRGLEAAIEAALEGQLDAVLVPENADLQVAVHVLQDSAAGRATIISLRDLRPAHALNLSSERGVLGVASRFVKCESRYRDLLETLLGRVIVVEDLATAQAMLRRGLGTIVTLDGTLFRPSGMVRAGSRGPGGLALPYEQELAELPERIAALQSEAQNRTAVAERAREQARGAESRLRELEARLETLQARRRRTLEDLTAARSGVVGLRGEAGWLRGTLQTFAGRQATLQRDAVAAEEERGRAAQAVRMTQVTVEQRRREVDALRLPVEEARGRLAVTHGARQALEQQRLALGRLREARRQALTRNERALASRAGETTARQAELDLVLSERETLIGEVEALRAQLAEARALLQPLRERVSRLAQAERELYEQHASRRAELLTRERVAMDAESSVNRAAQSADRLQEEIEAEGLPLAEITGGQHSERVVTPAGAAAESSTTKAGTLTVESLSATVRSLRGRIRTLGPINAQAQADYQEAHERHSFLVSQVADLQTAEASLQEALDDLRKAVRERFRETFQTVNADFGRYFRSFFGGGNARLALTEPEDYSESGVDILAQPPGKRQQHLQLLSGGERSMAAVALLFALLESNPAPFCVLDEVDAALDEANVQRFSETLAGLAERTQFILITHNRATLAGANSIYGVTMSGDGVSSILSLRLEDVPA